jgi:hypothetical protein
MCPEWIWLGIWKTEILESWLMLDLSQRPIRDTQKKENPAEAGSLFNNELFLVILSH